MISVIANEGNFSAAAAPAGVAPAIAQFLPIIIILLLFPIVFRHRISYFNPILRLLIILIQLLAVVAVVVFIICILDLI